MTRTITTLEERWALPRGTVIRDAAGVAWVKRPVSWMATTPIEDDQWIGMPATVLYDPSDPAPAPSVVPEAAVETLRAVIDEVLADALGDTFSPSVMDDLTQRVHANVAAALPHLTAQPAPEASREDLVGILVGLGAMSPDHGADAASRAALVADILLARFVITERGEMWIIDDAAFEDAARSEHHAEGLLELANPKEADHA